MQTYRCLTGKAETRASHGQHTCESVINNELVRYGVTRIITQLEGRIWNSSSSKTLARQGPSLDMTSPANTHRQYLIERKHHKYNGQFLPESSLAMLQA